ncbi:hypothetical protein GNP80_19850, partial [Aliivibrio fischeri]
MINKFKQQLATIIVSSFLLVPSTFANSPKDYSNIINTEKYTCIPPINAYVNDEVILGGKATFKEFIEVFPSNYADYVKMFHIAEVNRQDKQSQWCEGRYAISSDKMEDVMNHWTSLFTKKNAIQWYQITLSNLAGPFQIDNYPLLAQAMWNTLDKENLMLQLTALKTLPLSTQKILVNAYKLSPT